MRRLDWGAIGINVWGGLASGNPYATWGAPPNRHTDVDIQSGKGTLGNCLWILNARKTVLRGTWCDSALTSMCAVNSSSPAIHKALAGLVTAQSFTSFFRLVGATLTGWY